MVKNNAIKATENPKDGEVREVCFLSLSLNPQFGLSCRNKTFASLAFVHSRNPHQLEAFSIISRPGATDVLKISI